jgi:hypothetical protein
MEELLFNALIMPAEIHSFFSGDDLGRVFEVLVVNVEGTLHDRVELMVPLISLEIAGFGLAV